MKPPMSVILALKILPDMGEVARILGNHREIGEVSMQERDINSCSVIMCNGGKGPRITTSLEIDDRKN